MVRQNQLPPQVLAEIVARFGDRPEPTTRSSTRFPLRDCPAIARVRRDHGPVEQIAIQVMDLAITGMGFKTPVPLMPGSLLSVELQAEGLAPQNWACLVVNVYGFDGKDYRVGATFEATRLAIGRA